MRIKILFCILSLTMNLRTAGPEEYEKQFSAFSAALNAGNLASAENIRKQIGNWWTADRKKRLLPLQQIASSLRVAKNDDVEQQRTIIDAFLAEQDAKLSQLRAVARPAAAPSGAASMRPTPTPTPMSTSSAAPMAVSSPSAAPVVPRPSISAPSAPTPSAPAAPVVVRPDLNTVIGALPVPASETSFSVYAKVLEGLFKESAYLQSLIPSGISRDGTKRIEEVWEIQKKIAALLDQAAKKIDNLEYLSVLVEASPIQQTRFQNLVLRIWPDIAIPHILDEMLESAQAEIARRMSLVGQRPATPPRQPSPARAAGQQPVGGGTFFSELTQLSRALGQAQQKLRESGDVHEIRVPLLQALMIFEGSSQQAELLRATEAERQELSNMADRRLPLAEHSQINLLLQQFRSGGGAGRGAQPMRPATPPAAGGARQQLELDPTPDRSLIRSLISESETNYNAYEKAIDGFLQTAEDYMIFAAQNDNNPELLKVSWGAINNAAHVLLQAAKKVSNVWSLPELYDRVNNMQSQFQSTLLSAGYEAPVAVATMLRTLGSASVEISRRAGGGGAPAPSAGQQPGLSAEEKILDEIKKAYEKAVKEKDLEFVEQEPIGELKTDIAVLVSGNKYTFFVASNLATFWKTEVPSFSHADWEQRSYGFSGLHARLILKNPVTGTAFARGNIIYVFKYTGLGSFPFELLKKYDDPTAFIRKYATN